MVFHREHYGRSVAYEKFSDTLYASNDGPESCSDNHSKATSELQRYKLAAATLGLLCLLQLSLIISLALSASSNKSLIEGEKNELKTLNSGLNARNKNLTTEREQLRRNLSDFVSQHNYLTKERDELKKTNLGFLSNLKNLTAEREMLLRTIKGTEADNKYVTEQRDELRKELKNLTLEFSFLTEERDELKEINLGIEANLKNLTDVGETLIRTINVTDAINKNLTEERDELRKDLNNLASHLSSLTNERNELKKLNSDIEASLKNLSEESEKLIQTIQNIESDHKNVTGERDDLVRELNVFKMCFLFFSFFLWIIFPLKITASQLASMTKERDDLKKINSDIEANSNTLREDKDELNRKLNDLESKQNALTEERDTLRTTKSYIEAMSRTISQERDELKAKINTLNQPGWVLFEGSAYYVSSGKKTWQESRNYCQSKGADLMIINSRSKQVYGNKFQKYMWIGLTDGETDGTWKWVDGSLVTTSYWTVGEPNGKTLENCGNIKTYTTENSWNDELCSHSLNWICELKLI
ncbi:CD209 antigen-like isoform X2 [Xiphophorus maculatus]|uniref:CD209 antigen-like isoform X2 n=1 Tax=Xiphophorus maculatus TaxID=8083 RepID=UPI000C6CA179|nr:CD209 antigen-like isoform X2 [Xiphophorus maculatus]